MKRKSTLLALIATSILIASCGGTGDAVRKIAGPFLSTNDAEAVVIDQLFINGGAEGNFTGRGNFSVYLRDAVTNSDFACTTQEGGMAKLSIPTLYYGALEIPFRPIEGVEPTSAARMQLLFVEQDGKGCPAKLGIDDTIIGTSAQFTLNDAFNSQIWATNGKALAILRPSYEDGLSIPSQTPATKMGLYIDKLFFQSDMQDAKFYVVAEINSGNSSAKFCEIDEKSMNKIRNGGIEYDALGFPIDCIDPSDPSFPSTPLKISLYGQTDGGPQLIGETEIQKIEDIVGERLDFSNGSGFISFRGIAEEPFAIDKIRLEDMIRMRISSIEHKATLSDGAAIELIAVDPSNDYMVACVGPAQGLSGITTTGIHDGIGLDLIAADGMKELFGWDGIRFELIERQDGLSCPVAPPSGDYTIIAKSGTLAAAHLKSGKILFQNDEGSVIFDMDSTL